VVFNEELLEPTLELKHSLELSLLKICRRTVNFCCIFEGATELVFAAFSGTLGTPHFFRRRQVYSATGIICFRQQQHRNPTAKSITLLPVRLSSISM